MKAKRVYSSVISLMLALFLLAGTLCPVEAESATPQQQIIDSLYSGDETDLSGYSLTEEDVKQMYCQLSLSGELPWFSDRNISLTVNEDTGFVHSFDPQTLDPQVYDYSLYEQKVAEILSNAVTDTMEPWQKALSVHDYLISHSCYDESQTKFLGYDLLVNGSAVCSGYAYAYMDLMNRLGIPCRVVDSKVMGFGSGHAWNLIQLDGSWYHVDLTWDDPTPNVQGRVMHTYFLLADEEIRSESDQGHYGWSSDIPCTDITYSRSFWRNINSQITFADPDTCFYCTAEDWHLHIERRDLATGETQILHTVEPQYVDIGSGQYCYQHNGLSLWNQRLYFSSLDTLYSSDFSGQDIRTEYEISPAETRRYIAGSFVFEDKAYLSLSNHDFDIYTQTAALEPTGYHVHDFQPEVVPPTCTQDGYTKYTCSCGLSYLADLVPTVGHQYIANVVDSTPFTTGTRVCTCIHCGKVIEEIIPRKPLGDLITPRSIIIMGILLGSIFLCINAVSHRKE